MSNFTAFSTFQTLGTPFDLSKASPTLSMTRKSPSYFCYSMYSRSISVNGISPGLSFVCKGQRDLWMLYSNLLVFFQEIPCHLSEDPTSSLKVSSFGCEIFLTVGALGDFLYRKFLYHSCSYHFKTSPYFILQSQLPLCSLQVSYQTFHSLAYFYCLFYA